MVAAAENVTIDLQEVQCVPAHAKKLAVLIEDNCVAKASQQVPLLQTYTSHKPQLDNGKTPRIQRQRRLGSRRYAAPEMGLQWGNCIPTP